MSVFTRRNAAPPQETDYKKYHPYVREDFRECCAYCLLHEVLAAGADNFELDHFRPKSLPEFADRVNDFYNIYYSCHVCNHTKWSKWPSEELIAQGYCFIDFCVEGFSEHFQEEVDGFWTPLTKPGEYTEGRLRLNRKHLVELRALLREISLLRGFSPIDWNSMDREATLRLIGPPEVERSRLM